MLRANAFGLLFAIASFALDAPLVRASPRAYEVQPEQAAQPSGDGAPPNDATAPLAPPLTAPLATTQPHTPSEPVRYVLFQNALDLRRDGSNYFVVNACDMRDGCTGGRQGELWFVKFRVDLEYDIVRAENRRSGHWYVTMPVRFIGFWDLFDRSEGAQSSPFLEMNYSPALEVSWDPRVPSGVHRHHLLASVGFRHESNGLGLFRRNRADLTLLSRSWNSPYLAASYRMRPWNHGELSVRAEGWLPIDAWSDPIVEWQDGSTDKRRLQHHLGYASLRIALTHSFRAWTTFTLAATARMYSVDLELRWNTKDESARWLREDSKRETGSVADQPPRELQTVNNYFHLDVLAHCFIGRGERLITANELRYSCYLGLGF